MTDRDGRFDWLINWWHSHGRPNHVEKASREQQRKRDIWMFTSTILSFVIAAIPFWALFQFVPSLPPGGVDGIVLAFVMVGFALLLDIFVIFPWGFDRFDLVAPWQFRDVEVENEQ